MSYEPEVIKSKVLEWVNHQRVYLGAEPLGELPRGYRSDNNNCVIAKCFESIGLTLTSYHGTSVIHGPRKDFCEYFPHPECVSYFVRAFDGGMYPELSLGGFKPYKASPATHYKGKAFWQNVCASTPNASTIAIKWKQISADLYLDTSNGAIPNSIKAMFDFQPAELAPAGGG